MITAYERILESEDGRVAIAEEHAIAHVAELICQLLAKSGMTRTEFASKMSVTPGRVTQMLDGDTNMTLATVARAMLAFNHVFECSSRPITEFCAAPVWKVHHSDSGWQPMQNITQTTQALAPYAGASAFNRLAV